MNTATGCYSLGLGLTVAALDILRADTDPRVRDALTYWPSEWRKTEVEIDWSRLEQQLVSDSARVRLDLARSLVAGDPVSLREIRSLDDENYAAFLAALGRAAHVQPR